MMNMVNAIQGLDTLVLPPTGPAQRDWALSELSFAGRSALAGWLSPDCTIAQMPGYFFISG